MERRGGRRALAPPHGCDSSPRVQGRAPDGVQGAGGAPLRPRMMPRPPVPTFALNFYNTAVADQLRSGRKTATIRLGDKSPKYRKGLIVTVLCGARYGQRDKIFDAVIDKVEVKDGDLSDDWRPAHGRTRSRARRLAPGGEGGRTRPRGPARDLPQHADHARHRGARSHPLQAGQDPRLVLHGPRERGRCGRRRPPRWGRTTSGRRCTATWASTSPAASSRGGSSRSTWAARAGPTRGRDGNVHMAVPELGLHADGEPPPGDAAGRGRNGARVQDPRRPARRRRLVRRRAPPRAGTRTRA